MPGERMRNGHMAGHGGHGEGRVWPQEVGANGGTSDPRTPLAWQHRNLNYQQHQQQQHQQQKQKHAMQQQQGYLERLAAPAGHGHVAQHAGLQSGHPGGHQVQQHGAYGAEEGTQMPGAGARGRRASSPSTATSATSTSSSSAERSQKYDNAMLPMYPGMGGISVSAGTWDGEPCPIHHIPAINAILSPPPPPSAAMMLPPITTMSRRGTPSYAASLPPPPPDKGILMLLPPMMRPRPLVMPVAESGHPEPLPVRDPKALNTPFPAKESKTNKKMQTSSDCQGHTVVLWFVITIITIGVILAAVLRFVMG